MFHSQSHKSIACHRIALIGLVLSITGCISATQDDNLAPAETLKPAGWFDVKSSLAGDNFDEYATNVKQRLIDYRVPVNQVEAAIEVDRAAPKEFKPIDTCNDEVRGIAILVHGLSDTAFAMSDLAQYFATRCYIARTVLLPGHGTRAGDMLVVRHTHWTDTIRHLVGQASRENDTVVLVGFSLGAVANMTVALDKDSPVDALIALSPAFHISTWPLARLTPYVHRLYRWVDKGLAEDSLRYESMPTRGIAEFARASKTMHRKYKRTGGFKRPLLLIHSLDDNTTLPELNRNFVLNDNPQARVVEFFSNQDVSNSEARIERISSVSETYRVNGLTHLAVHVSPDNPHYGFNGSYRHCGTVDGRPRDQSLKCEQATELNYVDWDKVPPVSGPATALSSFNPNFEKLASPLDKLLDELEP